MRPIRSRGGASDHQPRRAAEDRADDLLDEIDEVLENNAEDFVRNYVQKGGKSGAVLLRVRARLAADGHAAA